MTIAVFSTGGSSWVSNSNFASNKPNSNLCTLSIPAGVITNQTDNVSKDIHIVGSTGASLFYHSLYMNLYVIVDVNTIAQAEAALPPPFYNGRAIYIHQDGGTVTAFAAEEQGNGFVWITIAGGHTVEESTITSHDNFDWSGVNTNPYILDSPYVLATRMGDGGVIQNGTCLITERYQRGRISLHPMYGSMNYTAAHPHTIQSTASSNHDYFYVAEEIYVFALDATLPGVMSWLVGKPTGTIAILPYKLAGGLVDINGDIQELSFYEVQTASGNGTLPIIPPAAPELGPPAPTSGYGISTPHTGMYKLMLSPGGRPTNNELIGTDKFKIERDGDLVTVYIDKKHVLGPDSGTGVVSINNNDVRRDADEIWGKNYLYLHRSERIGSEYHRGITLLYQDEGGLQMDDGNGKSAFPTNIVGYLNGAERSSASFSIVRLYREARSSPNPDWNALAWHGTNQAPPPQRDGLFIQHDKPYLFTRVPGGPMLPGETLAAGTFRAVSHQGNLLVFVDGKLMNDARVGDNSVVALSVRSVTAGGSVMPLTEMWFLPPGVNRVPDEVAYTVPHFFFREDGSVGFSSGQTGYGVVHLTAYGTSPVGVIWAEHPHTAGWRCPGNGQPATWDGDLPTVGNPPNCTGTWDCPSGGGAAEWVGSVDPYGTPPNCDGYYECPGDGADPVWVGTSTPYGAIPDCTGHYECQTDNAPAVWVGSVTPYGTPPNCTVDGGGGGGGGGGGTQPATEQLFYHELDAQGRQVDLGEERIYYNTRDNHIYCSYLEQGVLSGYFLVDASSASGLLDILRSAHEIFITNSYNSNETGTIPGNVTIEQMPGNPFDVKFYIKGQSAAITLHNAAPTNTVVKTITSQSGLTDGGLVLELATTHLVDGGTLDISGRGFWFTTQYTDGSARPTRLIVDYVNPLSTSTGYGVSFAYGQKGYHQTGSDIYFMFSANHWTDITWESDGLPTLDNKTILIKLLPPRNISTQQMEVITANGSQPFDHLVGMKGWDLTSVWSFSLKKSGTGVRVVVSENGYIRGDTALPLAGIDWFLEGSFGWLNISTGPTRDLFRNIHTYLDNTPPPTGGGGHWSCPGNGQSAVWIGDLPTVGTAPSCTGRWECQVDNAPAVWVGSSVPYGSPPDCTVSGGSGYWSCPGNGQAATWIGDLPTVGNPPDCTGHWECPSNGGSPAWVGPSAPYGSEPECGGSQVGCGSMVEFTNFELPIVVLATPPHVGQTPVIDTSLLSSTSMSVWKFTGGTGTIYTRYAIPSKFITSDDSDKRVIISYGTPDIQQYDIVSAASSVVIAYTALHIPAVADQNKVLINVIAIDADSQSARWRLHTPDNGSWSSVYSFLYVHHGQLNFDGVENNCGGGSGGGEEDENALWSCSRDLPEVSSPTFDLESGGNVVVYIQASKEAFVTYEITNAGSAVSIITATLGDPTNLSDVNLIINQVTIEETDVITGRTLVKAGEEFKVSSNGGAGSIKTTIIERTV